MCVCLCVCQALNAGEVLKVEMAQTENTHSQRASAASLFPVSLRNRTLYQLCLRLTICRLCTSSDLSSPLNRSLHISHLLLPSEYVDSLDCEAAVSRGRRVRTTPCSHTTYLSGKVLMLKNLALWLHVYMCAMRLM